MQTTKSHPRLTPFFTITASVIAVVSLLTALADVPQPVLSITSLGSNQFNIVITNAVTTTNYTLFWTPYLGNPSYPWEVIGIANVGETNFMVDGSEWASGFFRATLGIDSDGDGVPDWQDARPNDPAIGLMTVTIETPTNGSNVQ
jgi:hypothetical protein